MYQCTWVKNHSISADRTMLACDTEHALQHRTMVARLPCKCILHIHPARDSIKNKWSTSYLSSGNDVDTFARKTLLVEGICSLDSSNDSFFFWLIVDTEHGRGRRQSREYENSLHFCYLLLNIADAHCVDTDTCTRKVEYTKIVTLTHKTYR